MLSGYLTSMGKKACAEYGFCTGAERHEIAHSLWWQASEQGNEHAAMLKGDVYYYGQGTEHEHGQGLPLDLHLAKRYYDQAVEIDPAAKLPVTLALSSLWVRKNCADSFLVDFIDSLRKVFPKVQSWVDNVVMEEGNATILTLFVHPLTILYLRERQRRHAVVKAGEAANLHQPNDPVAPTGL